MTGRRDRPVLDRLAARSVVQTTERAAEIGDCLVWTGSLVGRGDTGHDGHGRFWLGGRPWLVHRAAWIERHGPIPPETPLVLHRCDNPPCWRDEHLYLGTHADNARDKKARGRIWQREVTHCPAGHEYTEENTRIYRGSRNCKACDRARPPRSRSKQIRRHNRDVTA